MLVNLVLQVAARHVRQDEVHSLACAQALFVVGRYLAHQKGCTATVVLHDRGVHERQRVGTTEAAHRLDLGKRLPHRLGTMLAADLCESCIVPF